jgi:hypothetical protein
MNAVAFFWIATAFIKEQPKYPVHISFHHFAGDKKLILDTVTYRNELGQPFIVTKFKYYVGNITLNNVNGTSITFPNYFLINEEEDDSKTITPGALPQGEYTGISFLVGVDSADNCSGAQAGALDPANAMFWAWNTGYIFMKLEGKSPASKSPGNIFEYHIGGYKQPSNCIRRVSLKFNHQLAISDVNNCLSIKIDVLEILKHPTVLDFSKLSSVTDFHNATTVADNYTDMFSILSTTK